MLKPESESRTAAACNDREGAKAMLGKANHPFVWGMATAAVPLALLLSMSWGENTDLIRAYRWTGMLDGETIVDAKARLGVCDYTGHCDDVYVGTKGNLALQPLEEGGALEEKKPQAPSLSSRQPASWADAIGRTAHAVWGAGANIGELFLGPQQGTTQKTLS